MCTFSQLFLDILDITLFLDLSGNYSKDDDADEKNETKRGTFPTVSNRLLNHTAI